MATEWLQVSSGPTYLWKLSIQSGKLCSREDWNSLYQGKILVLPYTTRWKRTNHDRTQKQSTSNVPKFKFLHNTVHRNHFFSNNSVIFSTDAKKPNWKASFCFMKISEGSTYIQIQKEKYPCCKMNGYIPWQSNLAIRKLIWEVGSLHSIIPSLWFKELATSISNVTAPRLRLVFPHQIST